MTDTATETAPRLPAALYRAARAELRKLDLSPIGVDAEKVDDATLDRFVDAVASAVAASDRQAVAPAAPEATYVPPGVLACPRCGVYRGAETVRAFPGGDGDVACFECIPPSDDERAEITAAAAEITPDGAQRDELEP